MECPNCGAEMKEGSLYCEECGEDIHMVPDFEPELELNMEQSLEHVRKNVAVEKSRDQKRKAKPEKSKKSVKETIESWVRIIVWSFTVLFMIVMIVGGIKVSQYFSVDYQVSSAQKAVVKQEYEKAIQYYEHALELDRRNIGAKMEMAEVYYRMNDKAEYEKLLLEIVSDRFTDAEQLESAYGKLIAIYRARGDYQTINDMLLASGNEAIMAVYQSYLALPPQFSIPAGTYEEVDALKLTVTGNGVIYYTVDGKRPDENDERYMAPLLLENGDYVINAIFVNEYGIFSEVSTAIYHIKIDELVAPEINVDSGDYTVPVFITVMNDADDIYYTTDGTNPTLGSARYTEPIPMPLGVSNYHFARLEAGKTSIVIEKTYDLELDTDFSSDQAVKKIVNYAIESGKILDEFGHYDETGAAYLYQFQYAVHITDINDFYVVAEIFSDAMGNSVKTGNYFAVNVYSGYYYKLQIDNGSYTLIEL